MNSIQQHEAFLPHVSLVPADVVLTTFRRHPIFFWHKTHIRIVRCKLVEDPCTKILTAEYVDERTYNTFINKKSAEHYLGREIPELEHVGKLYVEKVRKVFAYYMCKKCNHIERLQIEVVFQGPFDIVSSPINTTTNRTCPHCNKASVQMDISTETSQKNNSNEDCDLAR